MSEKYFDKVAAEWDAIRIHLFPDVVREKAIAKTDIKTGDLAADIGAGTGFLSEILLSKGAKVTAFDQSTEMVNQLINKFGNLLYFSAKKGIDTNLPADENTFDYVFANMYLHHVENPQTAINEMVRILKPGGKLVITDLDEHNFDFLVTEQNDVWKGFKRRDIKEWFQKAGLREIAIECIDENCCSVSKGSNETAKISIFIASGEKGSSSKRISSTGSARPEPR